MNGRTPAETKEAAWRGTRRGLAAALLGTFVLLVLGTAGVPAAEKLKPGATQWKASKDFAKDAPDDKPRDRARTNLSGAACATTTPPFTSCLVVNDEKKYAQFFHIEGTTLVPGEVIRLVDKATNGDPDAEGAAYHDGFFYIVGSHGRGRHHPGQDNSARYSVFRFPVDQTTGKPTFTASEEEVVGVEPSSRLREALKNGRKIRKFYNKKLDKKGINIEGIAVKGGRMYLGLRGPSIKQHGFIVSVDADAVFTDDRPLNTDVRRLKLGRNAGIRDLASVKDGLLVLSGPMNEQDVDPAVFLWNEKDRTLKKLAELDLSDVAKGAKAETLLVLKDAAGEPWRVLVMFDGPENGAPTEYLIPR